MAAKKEPDKPKDDGVVEFVSSGQTMYAWRDDGRKPNIDLEAVSHNIHMILKSDADHWGPNRP